MFAKTEVTGSPSAMVTEWFKPESEGTRLTFSDDGCNSDADLLGDNSDPGDPRDGITSATGALVSASSNAPGAHQVETGGARSVRIIGPFGTPMGLIGTYTGINANSPPNTIESNRDGGFNPGEAVGKLDGVSYFKSPNSNGWHGANGLYPSGCIETVDYVGSGSSGHHDYVLPEHVNWKDGLDFVIIAGCSVLDINDYIEMYSGYQHTDSPGKRWATTGLGLLLGYNSGGPSDKPTGTNIASEWANLSDNGSRINAWRDANKSAKSWNACAIEAADAYYYFDYIPGVGSLTAEWTRIPKAEW